MVGWGMPWMTFLAPGFLPAPGFRDFWKDTG